MNFKVEVSPIIREHAESICKWSYEEPYSFYNLSHDEECIQELLNGSYYSVSDSKGELLGFYCYGESAQVPCGNVNAYVNKCFIDIGLGIKPELTGKGLGHDFVDLGIKFAKDKFSSSNIRLTVAIFNVRAIKVYERLGFKKEVYFKLKRINGDVEFVTMIKEEYK